MGQVPKNQAAITAFSVASATPVPADDYFERSDINRRPIDGERQPIDTCLLKRRAAARPDPGATGTVTKSVPTQANKRKPWSEAGQWAGGRRPPYSSMGNCGPESLSWPKCFTLGERKC